MKTVTLKLDDVPVFVRFALLGWHMAELEPGGAVRFHQLNRTTSNGDEVIATPYQREKLHETAADVVDRLKLPLRLRTDGLDLIVERIR